MTLLSIVVFSTCVLIAWLLWLEHREELSTAACMRRRQRTGRVQVSSFEDDNEMQIKYMNCTTLGLLARGADLVLKTLNVE